MDSNSLYRTYRCAIGEIERHALKPAFDKIRSLLQNNEHWDLQQSLEDVERNYRYLLSYLIDGIEDKERNNIYNSIVISSFHLADDVYLFSEIKSSSRLYYERKRLLQRNGYPDIGRIVRSLLSSKDELECEQFAANFFDACWLSNRLLVEERNSISSFFHHPDSKVYHRQLIISALMLGCLCHFDETKIRLLIEVSYDQTVEIRQRALVALMLLLLFYEKRILFYDTLMREISALCNESWFIQSARTITMQFILSQQTEKINDRFNKKFMEHINDIAPIIRNKLANNTFSEEDLYNEKNPEWQKSLHSEEMNKLMQEVMDLQTEGADLFVSTFSRLKHYPFFNTLSNWFLPYYGTHSAIRVDDNGKDEVLKITSLLCDSDKYSLMIAMSQLDNHFFKMIRNQIVENTEVLKEQQESNFTFDPTRKATVYSALYIHDLYRFFKYHPRHLDFYDPFNYAMNFYFIKPLERYLGDTDSLSIFAEYYLRRDLYNEAIPLFTKLTQLQTSHADFFQKLGYCFQMTQQPELALEAYLKAEIILPNHIWTLKKIALCYRQLKQPEKALAYYKSIESLQPNNKNILLNIGHLLLETGQKEEALKYYFQVEFSDPNNRKVWRPIAWCSLISGKYEQAMRYYDLILNDNPTASDWLNAGHTQVVSGAIRKGVELYIKSVECSSLEEFLTNFSEDIPTLLGLHLEELLLNALRDEVIYSATK